MLETLLKLELPFSIARHEDAPLLQERKAFLEHLRHQGTSLAAVRAVACQTLNIMRVLKLDRLRDVSLDEIKDAAQR